MNYFSTLFAVMILAAGLTMTYAVFEGIYEEGYAGTFMAGHFGTVLIVMFVGCAAVYYFEKKIKSRKKYAKPAADTEQHG